MRRRILLLQTPIEKVKSLVKYNTSWSNKPDAEHWWENLPQSEPKLCEYMQSLSDSLRGVKYGTIFLAYYQESKQEWRMLGTTAPFFYEDNKDGTYNLWGAIVPDYGLYVVERDTRLTSGTTTRVQFLKRSIPYALIATLTKDDLNLYYANYPIYPLGTTFKPTYLKEIPFDATLQGTEDYPYVVKVNDTIYQSKKEILYLLNVKKGIRIYLHADSLINGVPVKQVNGFAKTIPIEPTGVCNGEYYYNGSLYFKKESMATNHYMYKIAWSYYSSSYWYLQDWIGEPIKGKD